MPEIDLARIAPLTSEGKRRTLEGFRLGHPPYSYDPMRNSLLDILNIKPELFDLRRVPWDNIGAIIEQRSRNAAEAEANLRAAEGLYDYADENALSGRKHDFLPLALRIGYKVVYWHSLILIEGDRPFVPFFDPRRSSRLTPAARRFVFSMMHERIRVADPDFANVRLGIFQFSTATDGPREATLYTDNGVELFTVGELEEMVRETYELWAEICQERDKDVRRRAGGSRGRLL